jgi:HEPN domain-containing protein
MKTHIHANTTKLTRQRTDCELQLTNFFDYYPIELIEHKILSLLEPVIPHPLETAENYGVNTNYLFYEELNLALKNCKLLLGRKSRLNEDAKSIEAIVLFIKEVLPISYIFCTSLSPRRTDLIIVMDQHKHKRFEEAYALLNFAMLGHENINCTVYTYGTIYDLLTKGHLYFSAICIAENCVYQSTPHFTLPSLTQAKRSELLAKSSPLFQQNIHKAITFFNGARQFANEKERTIAAFMLQQACELTYRSLLLSLRGKDIKSHDLVALRKHLSHFAPTILGVFDDKEDAEIRILTSIQEAYIDSRYNQTYQVSLKELNKSLAACDTLILTAQGIYNYYCEKISVLACTCT